LLSLNLSQFIIPKNLIEPKTFKYTENILLL